MQDRQLAIALPIIFMSMESKMNIMAYLEVAPARLWVIGNSAVKFAIVKVSILYVTAL